METQKNDSTEKLKAELMERLKAELMGAQKAELEKVKNEKVGSCLYDLRTAFIDKVPQGLKGRESFVLNVVKIDVMPSNIKNLIDWLRKNGREERASEIEANKERFFDISIVADDGTAELFSSGILSYDKKNSLKELIVKSKDGFDYYVNTVSWDAEKKELFFS